MLTDALRAKWALGTVTFATAVASGSAVVAQALAHQGWDAVTIDAQHGACGYDQATTLIAACGSSATPIFVRVGGNDAAAITRMLDAGALGIICPAIEGAEEARRFVGACRYAPAGTRSFGPLGALARFGEDYARQANGAIVTQAMIETRAGVDRLDEILDVEGLDAVFVGPADLSLSYGWGHRFSLDRPEAAAIVAAIARKARARGLVPAIHVVDPVAVPAMIDLGYQHIVIANDMRLLTRASAEVLEKLRR